MKIIRSFKHLFLTAILICLQSFIANAAQQPPEEDLLKAFMAQGLTREQAIEACRDPQLCSLVADLEKHAKELASKGFTSEQIREILEQSLKAAANLNNAIFSSVVPGMSESEIEKEIIEKIQQINLSAQQMQQALEIFAAAKKGDIFTIQKFIDQNSLVLQRQQGFPSALTVAAVNGHANVVKLLLKAIADGKALASSEGPPFVDDANDEVDGLTPLMALAQLPKIESGHQRATTMLVKAGATVDAINKSKKEGYEGQTAIMFAADSGNDLMVKYLKHIGANINAKNKKGYTALIIATIKNHKKVVLHILFADKVFDGHLLPLADPNLQDAAGSTALMTAAMQGHENIAAMLLGRSDINVEATPPGLPQLTARTLATLSNKPHIVQMIDNKKAGLDKTIYDAIAKKDANAIKEVINKMKHQVVPSPLTPLQTLHIYNAAGHTPLHATVFANQYDNTRFLLYNNFALWEEPTASGDDVIVLAAKCPNILNLFMDIAYASKDEQKKKKDDVAFVNPAPKTQRENQSSNIQQPLLVEQPLRRQPPQIGRPPAHLIAPPSTTGCKTSCTIL